MSKSEVEQVLANWLAEANASTGRVVEGFDPAAWVAERFLHWWQSRVRDDLDDADRAIEGAREGLNRLGGWTNESLSDVLHELTHASDAIAALRGALELTPDRSRDDHKTNARCVADVDGPWVDGDFSSGLIERCKRYWHVPITEVPNEALATYLRQRIALELVIPEARTRVERGSEDGTEMYDDELTEALRTATERREQ